MHAVLVTFTSAAPAHHSAAFDRHAADLGGVTGLLAMTRIADGSLQGGFYLFADATAADGYLVGDLFESLRRDDGLYAFEVRRFAVLAVLDADGPRTRGDHPDVVVM